MPRAHLRTIYGFKGEIQGDEDGARFRSGFGVAKDFGSDGRRIDGTPCQFMSAQAPLRAFTPPIHSALSLLMDAATCAQDVGAELWQFSVEISALLRTGLTTNECRWLVAKGLAKHACEMTTHEADRRVFQPCTNLALPKRTCFVITERGMACTTELLRAAAKRQSGDHHHFGRKRPPGVRQRRAARCDSRRGTRIGSNCASAGSS